MLILHRPASEEEEEPQQQSRIEVTSHGNVVSRIILDYKMFLWVTSMFIIANGEIVSHVVSG